MPKGRGSKFYQTEEFKKLHAIWVTGKKTKIVREGKPLSVFQPSKLAKSGFLDAESPSGVLRVKNKRTQSYGQQDDLARISSALCAYISNPDISLKKVERRVLDLHSQGFYRKRIMLLVSLSHQTVWKIIKHHTPIALGLYGKDDEE